MSDVDDAPPDRGTARARPAHSLPSVYPPDDHVLRDLPFEMEETGPRSAVSHLRLTPNHCREGRVDPATLLVLTDVLGGFLVGRVIAPDWMATAQLALHMFEPPGVGDLRIGATVVRSGRSTVVVSADIDIDIAVGPAGPDGHAAPGAGSNGPRRAGAAELTFVRLPRRDTTLDLPTDGPSAGRRLSLAVPGSGLTSPLRRSIGVDESRGSVALEVTPYVRNSFGAVNGGVVAALAAVAAEGAAAERTGVPVRVADVVVTYLAQARVGPVEASASVLRVDGPVALVRVEVRDLGLPDDDGRPRVAVTAHVHCVADADARPGKVRSGVHDAGGAAGSQGAVEGPGHEPLHR